MLRFKEEGHIYQDIINPTRKWTGVTTVIGKYKGKFDDNIAYKNSKDPDSKWYKTPPEEIKRIWKQEADRSTTLGSWYHKKQEEGEVTGIQCCPVENEWKYAGNQILVEGIHPEYLLYHPDYAICGQADRLEVKENTLSVRDYKSNKKIETKSWNGKKMMLPPVSHLQECHLNIYSLQLSMYAVITLHHNPNLVIGDLEIYHVVFENSGYDKWGYPITAIDEKGDYVAKEVNIIKCEFMEKEVKAIMENYKNTHNGNNK